MPKPQPKCLFNHELLILFTTQSPYQTYRDDVTDDHPIGLVRELEGTGVDTLMCCPQSWMTPAWHSEVDRKWLDEAPQQVEPAPASDWKYFEKAYYRMRRYMLQDPPPDPVGLTLETAREIGLNGFLSYRMNEIHHVIHPDCPTHSKFWRDNPQYRIPQPGTEGQGGPFTPLNYMEEAVRERYFAILAELVERYDIDGFELDFMRHRYLFPKGQEPEGRPLLTEFVRRFRKLLDDTGAERGKELALSVRVPWTPQMAFDLGMDVAAWDAEGLVDMVNASSHFRNTQEIDIEAWRQSVPRALLYGEMHFVEMGGSAPSGFRKSIGRLTSPATYRGTALSFWDRGVDGVSFFNLGYCRDKSFADPRRRLYPGCEPPFDATRTATDVEWLRARPKNYTLVPGFGSLPATLRSRASHEAKIHVADTMETGHPFKEAVLRVETHEPSQVFDLEVALNGAVLERFSGRGELFEPYSKEALPSPDRLHHYHVPLDALKHGYNTVAVTNRTIGQADKSSVQIERFDLALYTQKQD